ncbi:hypothetical protein HK098_001200 [Nowakowskiella sp. JEL0407]|nr:hypothetical protein HK098_001200 [Nowakowskiella sp. JEL0407]
MQEFLRFVKSRQERIYNQTDTPPKVLFDEHESDFVDFPSKNNNVKFSPVSLVGGKGYSLLRMAHAQLNIPKGRILTTKFFSPWTDQLRNLPEYNDLVELISAADSDATGTSTHDDSLIRKKLNQLKTILEGELEFTDLMLEIVDGVWDAFGFEVVAVRSSSPEEDLQESSFAGIYETKLGITRSTLHQAIKSIYLSTLNPSLYMYKNTAAEKITFQPSQIAIVIQSQIPSQSAGVAFSVNPITNSNREIIVTANFGLGESVVDGSVTPDSWRLEKVLSKDKKNYRYNVLEFKMGEKLRGVVLNQDGSGGVTWLNRDEMIQRCSGGVPLNMFPPPTNRPCLSEDMVKKVAKETAKAENLYRTPIDIEFGVYDDELFVLQARPVTTVLPFPDLREANVEYFWDMTLGIQGLPRPLSIMSIDLISLIIDLTTYIVTHKLNKKQLPIVPIPETGRIYNKVSNQPSFIRKFTNYEMRVMDPVSKDIIDDLEKHKRLKKEHTGGHGWEIVKLIAGAVVHAPVLNFWLKKNQISKHPLKSITEVRAKVDSFFVEISKFDVDETIGNVRASEITEPLSQTFSILEFTVALLEKLIKFMVSEIIPIMYVSRVARHDMHRFLNENRLLDSEDAQLKYANLESGLDGNVTVEMGLDLARIGDAIGFEVTHAEELDMEGLRDGLENRSFGEGSELWERFLKKYGHRGDVELDIATPRYRENPETLLNQLLRILKQPEDTSTAPKPILTFESAKKSRTQSYFYFLTQLQQRPQTSTKKIREFQKLYNKITLLGGFRETPKFIVIKVFDIIRSNILRVGREIFEHSTRTSSAVKTIINKVEDVFEFGIIDLDNLCCFVKFDDGDESQHENLPCTAKKVEDLRNERVRIWNVWDRFSVSASVNGVRDLPRIIDSTGRIYRPKGKVSGSPNQLLGYPVSSGVVTGKIRKIYTTEQESDSGSTTQQTISPGDILVAKCSNPGWTPLMLNASGIILEVGGVLQHGVLVAREYGIPAVAGVVGLLDDERVKDGVEVSVDGNEGVIEFL